MEVGRGVRVGRRVAVGLGVGVFVGWGVGEIVGWVVGVAVGFSGGDELLQAFRKTAALKINIAKINREDFIGKPLSERLQLTCGGKD